ncbi:helix-turn-helix transcriptional regulator [Streptomyces sp. NPDC059994]|uniref:helix-turn-helix domain-containing protein n=1 Tax=Streptomyces sp. NPDC059994 TaxID=3347029 RepID=UPI0036B6B84B
MTGSSPRSGRRLTARQREVLLLAANGNTNADIGRWLWISPDTVSSILAAAYRALGVHSRAHAVAVALRESEFGLGDIRLPDEDQYPIREAS